MSHTRIRTAARTKTSGSAGGIDPAVWSHISVASLRLVSVDEPVGTYTIKDFAEDLARTVPNR